MNKKFSIKDLEKMRKAVSEISSSTPDNLNIELSETYPLSAALRLCELSKEPITFTQDKNTFELKMVERNK